jgi:hypothetical protein
LIAKAPTGKEMQVVFSKSMICGRDSDADKSWCQGLRASLQKDLRQAIKMSTERGRAQTHTTVTP